MNNWEKMDEHDGVKKPVEASGYSRFGPRDRSIYTLPVSTSTWFWLIFLLVIPIVNIIALLIMVLSDNINENIKNYARASLIWVAIGLFLVIIF